MLRDVSLVRGPGSSKLNDFGEHRVVDGHVIKVCRFSRSRDKPRYRNSILMLKGGTTFYIDLYFYIVAHFRFKLTIRVQYFGLELPNILCAAAINMNEYFEYFFF